MATRHNVLSARRLLAASVSALAVVTLVPAAAFADPRPSIAQVQQQLDDLSHQAEVASEAYNGAELASADAQRKLQKLQGQVADSEAKVKALQGVMGGFAAAAYRTGGIDSTLQLLLADNPQQFLDQASSLDGVARHQAETLRKILLAKQQVAQDQVVADQQASALAAAKKAAAQAKAQIDAKTAATQQLLNSLKEEERKRLEAARAAAAAAAAERARQAAARLAAQQAAAQAARTAAAARATRSVSAPAPAAPAPSSVPASGRASIAVAFAMAQLGKAYVFGAAGPNAYDCSGLTMRAYGAAGVSLPHFAAAQYNMGHHVGRNDLQPGDLVFYYSGISHVGIYIGGGQIIHAANPREGVLVAPVFSMPFVGATRL